MNMVERLQLLICLFFLFIGHSVYSQQNDNIIDPEEIAAPLDGFESFYKFVDNEFDEGLIHKYKPSGKVYVELEIDSAGHLSNSKILKGINVKIDKECLRIIKAYGGWKPSKMYGRPIDGSLTIPIIFPTKFYKNKK